MSSPKCLVYILRSVANPTITHYTKTTVSAGGILCVCPASVINARSTLGTTPYMGPSILINLTTKPSLILSSSNREPVNKGWAETDIQ